MKSQPMPPMMQPPQLTREQFVESLFKIEKPDNYLSGKKAIDKLIDGVQKGFDIIKGSYGSAGSNVKIKRDLYPYHESTNDGKKILEAIKLSNEYEMMGLNSLKEVADKCDKESGDGRKTASILYSATLIEGQKCKEDPMDIKRSLEECIPLIAESIKKQTIPITVNEVGSIARIASENEKLGSIFQEIYKQIGSDGIVELENSGTSDTYYEITEGVKLLNCGYMYPYMTNSDKGRKAEYKSPYILIAKQKIVNPSQIDKLIRDLIKSQIYELVIFCDDIDMSVSSYLGNLAINGEVIPINGSMEQVFFKTLVIKAPVLWKDWLFEDFSKITGAVVINPAEGTTLKNLRIEQLGRCEKISTSKTETVVLGTKDISEHIQALSELNTDDSKIRISRLKTKTAILKLGANSDTELSHLKGKALDARNSSYLAMQGGIVPGGGASLLQAAKDLPDTVGGKILKKALEYPISIISKNLGLKTTPKRFSHDVVDASVVVINSITNAISVAATDLSNNTLIL